MASIDQGEFEATKALNSCRTLHYDKRQLCAKMAVST